MIIYPLFLVSSLVSTPESWGAFGEMKTASIFHPNFFGKDGQILINNIHISENGTDHQIDHIVLLPYGIFVVETKNIFGTILGQESDLMWNCINRGRMISIYNPIKQNETHCRVIKEFLGVKEVVSVVVFGNSNKPEGLPRYVVNLEELKPFVKSFNKGEIYTKEELTALKNKLTKQN